MKFLKKISETFVLTIKELKLVEWISLEQTASSTILILVISFVIGIIIVVFDTFFFEIRNLLISL